MQHTEAFDSHIKQKYENTANKNNKAITVIRKKTQKAEILSIYIYFLILF